jgi:hypothetical protein
MELAEAQKIAVVIEGTGKRKALLQRLNEAFPKFMWTLRYDKLLDEINVEVVWRTSYDYEDQDSRDQS